MLSGMNLNPDVCYRALRARDTRFDGRFFTGVESTGVYCRPVCPARTPKRGNCTFFRHAAAAEEAGFRPCLRCRPETSPGTPAWQGASTTVCRALRLIDQGALDGGGVDDLAARLGVGDRHLRRLFVEHLGASPLSVAMTRRVHFAKRLLEETRLPVSQVAVTAGFNNSRRFNAAFRRCFDRTPGEVRRGTRKTAPPADANGKIRLRLPYRPPLAWEPLLGFLGPRAIPGVERIDGVTYRRSFALDAVEGELSVSPGPDGRSLLLTVSVEAAPRLMEVVERVRALLDLAADPQVIESQLRDDADLSRLRVAAGLRVPGAWDRFEVAVRAILGQQITVAGATRISGRLVRSFGRRLASWPAEGSADPDSLGWVFPRPEDLARAPLNRIAAIGIPDSRAATIRGLARAVAAGRPMLDPAADLEDAVSRLITLDGIGDWTARYVAMRALAQPDAFPAGDLGLRKALSSTPRPLTPGALARRSEAWRPWRAYAAVRLWTALTARSEKRR